MARPPARRMARSPARRLAGPSADAAPAPAATASAAGPSGTGQRHRPAPRQAGRTGAEIRAGPGPGRGVREPLYPGPGPGPEADRRRRDAGLTGLPVLVCCALSGTQHTSRRLSRSLGSAREVLEHVAEVPVRLGDARAGAGALGARAAAVVALERPERQEPDALLLGPLQDRERVRGGE